MAVKRWADRRCDAYPDNFGSYYSIPMARHAVSGLLALTTSFAACAQPVPSANPVPVTRTAAEKPVIAVQSFAHGLSAVHAANSAVKLRIGHDPSMADQRVLFVDYPPPTENPGSRDVWCDSENSDWTSGNGIAFQIKAANHERLSFSFFDRNRVAYTTWIELQGGVWQPVRISFDNLRPNPYFQPPDAKLGVPVDLSEINRFGFAPHSEASGQLLLTKFILTR